MTVILIRDSIKEATRPLDPKDLGLKHTSMY